MTYFTFQRILTFFTGLGILFSATLAYSSTNPLIHYMLTTLAIILGAYILIASLIPYKDTSKGVAEIVLELFIQLFIELIPRMLAALFRFFGHFLH